MPEKKEEYNHKQFSEFLLREYDNIASAYFNIKNSISIFFRYYILITSIPITILLFLYCQQSSDNILQTIPIEIGAIICFLIAFVGACLMMYVLSMNYTSTLYARQVNGIRFFFYEVADLDKVLKDKIRVLPINRKEPSYSFLRSIKYLLFAFASINSSYFTLGCYISGVTSSSQLAFYWIGAFALQFLVCLLRTFCKADK